MVGIETIIRARVRRALRSFSIILQNEVINTLMYKAGGLFLWATIALDIVCKARGEWKIREALESLPFGSKMESLYGADHRTNIRRMCR